MTRICELCNQTAVKLAKRGRTNDRCQTHLEAEERQARQANRKPTDQDLVAKSIEDVINLLLSTPLPKKARSNVQSAVHKLESAFGLPNHRFAPPI